MTKKTDPLDRLALSLEDESAAVQRRFNDADRFTQGKRPGPARSAPAARAVRDAFSFPPADHGLIADLQNRCLAGGANATKSQIVRAGLHALTDLPLEPLLAYIARLEQLRQGRPRTR